MFIADALEQTTFGSDRQFGSEANSPEVHHRCSRNRRVGREAYLPVMHFPSYITVSLCSVKVFRHANHEARILCDSWFHKFSISAVGKLFANAKDLTYVYPMNFDWNREEFLTVLVYSPQYRCFTAKHV